MTTRPMNRRRMTRLAGIGAIAALLVGGGSSQAAIGALKPDIHLIMVFSDPHKGMEDAYDRWNTDGRLAAMTTVPGFVSARRFGYADLQLRPSVLKVPRHMVLYTVDTNDPARTMAEIKRRTTSARGRTAAPIDALTIVDYRLFRPEMTGVGGEPSDSASGLVQSYVIIVFQNAVAGEDDAFNTWYDNVHAPEMLSNPGFVGAERAVFSAVDQPSPLIWPRYLTLFKMVTRDLPAVYRLAMGGGKPSPALDRTTSFGYTYRAIGPVVEGRRH